MEIISTNMLWGTKWVNLFLRKYKNATGKISDYIMVSRQDIPDGHATKRPDAVVAIGWHDGSLVVTSEYRVPIAARELGFVAGLIDRKDYGDGLTIEEAAKAAAIREFHEETGMVFEPETVSPHNLYSSGGLTNESVIIVVGKASGPPSKEFLEGMEDIDVMLVPSGELYDLRDGKGRFEGMAVSQKIWCYLQGLIDG